MLLLKKRFTITLNQNLKRLGKKKTRQMAFRQSSTMQAFGWYAECLN